MPTPSKPESSSQLAVESPNAGDLRQSLFREVNDQIERLNAGWATDAEDVVLCECSNVDCHEPIEVTAAEYETVRRFPTRFLVRPGHAARERDRVVYETSEYVVVEKVGASAETAIRLDSRRAATRDRTLAR